MKVTNYYSTVLDVRKGHIKGFTQEYTCRVHTRFLKDSPMLFKDYKFLKILNFTLEMVAEILENLA